MFSKFIAKRVQIGARNLCASAKAEARQARRQKLDNSKGSLISTTSLVLLGVSGGIGYAVYDIVNNPKGLLGSYYYDSFIDKFFKDRVMGIFEPTSDKLIPDWPTDPIYGGNIPLGTPAPPLLILDLEKTLIGSTYDSRYGWRHVKRPGLDQFINALSQYYEIVIFSENDISAAQDILEAIDPQSKCHKLGASAAEIRGTTVLKRLDLMNRDIRRIILIDDNPESFQLCSPNTIQVRPFSIDDKGDNTLIDLIPFLQALVHEDIRDFPNLFNQLGTRDAESIVTEYNMRLYHRKNQEKEMRNKGVGAMLRQTRFLGAAEAEVASTVHSSIPSPLALIGNQPTDSLPFTPPVIPGMPNTAPRPAGEKKKGKLFSMLDEADKAKEKEEQDRRDKMNAIHMERQQKKLLEQQSQQGQE